MSSLQASLKAVLAGGLALLGIGASLSAQHDMTHMGTTMSVRLPLGIPWSRLGGGTAWEPDSSPMFAAHRSAGPWMLMLHGAAFPIYDYQLSFRGAKQLGLIDWEMLMAARSLGGGVVRLSAMTSLQPLALGRRGYPVLLQTGGSDNGARLVNRQHPHDLIGELSATYDHSLTNALAASVYLAPVGEPAIGPVSYMHRPSSREDPFAPIGHHWQDATHEAHGVVTAGVYGRRAKLEGSVFNGREPDNYRFNLDYYGARLDSYSGRFSLTPNPNVTMSAWAGYIYAHDRLEEPIGMQRYGVSLLQVERRGEQAWSNGIVWGLSVHHHGSRHHSHGDSTAKSYNLSTALLVESAIDVTRRATVYGRLEEVDKSADELGFLGGDPSESFTVHTVSLGASYDFLSRGSASVAVGVRGTLNLLPDALRLTYQANTPVGFAVYLRVRPRGATTSEASPPPIAGSR